MEIILRQDVEKIGKAGSVVKVKDGFARNFLIPNHLAVPVSAANLRKLEEEKKNRQLQLERAKKESEALKDKLTGLSLTMPVLTQEEEKLYGSIGAVEISRALQEEGFEIDKSYIRLEEPIKALGIYEVPIELHPEVSAKVKVWVVKK
jgi:large subunit ribosomal protein L9